MSSTTSPKKGTAASPEQAPNQPTNGSSHGSTLVWAKVFDVESAAPSNTLKGSVVPSILAHSHRRVSLEVHRFETVGGKVGPAAKEGVDYYDDCIVRVLVKEQTKEGKEARRKAKQAALEGGSVQQAVLNDGGEDDDGSVTIVQFADTGREINPSYAGWRAKYRIPIANLEIKGVHRKKVRCVAQVSNLKHNRAFIFESEEEAKEFVRLVEMQKEAEERRAAAKLKASLGSDQVALHRELTLLVEIVSAYDLPIADISATGKGSSDPYVQCFLNGKEVHRTKHISNTLDPIWTVKTKSLFLLPVTVGQLFAGEGLVCEVKDYDQFGKNDKLGAITVPPKVLYVGDGERKEYKLMKAQGQDRDYGTGVLAVRCRHASDYDIKFMESLHDDDKKDVLGLTALSKKAHKAKGGKGNIGSMLSRTKKTERDGDTKIVKYKARPGPDPKRNEETKWLTKEEVENEVTRESFHWIETGSGDLCRLFVEVLGCDDLPNLDTGGMLGNKTDAFVAVVFEDSMMQTDVIDDSLNPRWLPWSKRAFIFHPLHPSSQLFLGVFDFDQGYDDHDLIGRVAVEIANMRPNTVYNLKYDIYPTAQMTTRKRKGTLSIRLRLEVDDQRKLLLASLEPPPEIYVNVKKKKDFRVMRYTCQGKYDMDAYNMKVINSYVEELLAYQHLLYYVKDAVLHLLLWKGHFPLKLGRTTINLPLHSINAFLLGIFLVERPQLMPSFFFASIAWLLLAIMGFRRHVPNPWQSCKTFAEFSTTLAVGHSFAPPDSIEPFQNAEEAEAFEEWRENRIKESEEAARIAYEEALKQQEEEMKELEEIGGTDTDISTKTGGGVSFDVFKPFLFPIQQYLGAACGYLRIVKHIAIWTECYMAFWITVGCLVLSVTCCFVPWFFLIKWGSRIVVWTFLGPWMKLVDVFYVSKIKPPTEEEKALQKVEAERARRKKLEATITDARINRERANKLKDMKKIMFGKFITKVPVLKSDRHRDIPLPDSSAVPYQPEPLGLAELAMKEAGYNRTRLPGQHLVGDMVPHLETRSFTDAPTGQPTKNPHLLSKGTHAASIKKDSDAVAYAKIGTIIVAAGTITWFGVPILASGAEYLMGMVAS